VVHFWPRYLDLVVAMPSDVDPDGLFDDATGRALTPEEKREVLLVIELEAEHLGITGRNPFTGRFWARQHGDPGPAAPEEIIPYLVPIVATRNVKVPEGGWSIHDLWAELARRGQPFRHCDVYVTVHERPAELDLELHGQTYWFPREVRTCACGCGEPTVATWAAGHDGRYRGELHRAVLDGEVNNAGSRARLPMAGTPRERLDVAVRHLRANGHDELATRLRADVQPRLGATAQERLAADIAELKASAELDDEDAADADTAIETVFRRRARQLEREFCLKYVASRGTVGFEIEFDVAGGRIDVLDLSRPRRPRVVEAKLGAGLTSAAQAAGQADSYLWRLRRVNYGVEHLENGEVAVLLAAPPTADVCRYLAERSVVLIYLEGDGFVEVLPLAGTQPPR
jgi:hypothetical protein